jgi:hypothetical protein
MTGISDTTALWAALTAAKPGDTLLLGTANFGDFRRDAMAFAAPGITLQPAPGAKPVFSSFTSYRSGGVTLQDLEFAAKGTGIILAQGERFNLLRLNLHGAEVGLGVSLAAANKVSITFCEISHFGSGVNSSGCTDLTITDNALHDLHTDGILATAAVNATVSRNNIESFTPATGAHPDAIQFAAYQGVNSANVVIEDNIITRGNGSYIQGIFIEGTNNLTIVDNAMSGTMSNGISVSSTATALVKGNFVQGYVDMDSRITVRGGSSNVTVEGNVASAVNSVIDSGAPNPNFTSTDNTTIGPSAIGDNSAMAAWLKAKDPAIDPRDTLIQEYKTAFASVLAILQTVPK